jgi:hypothetical protein
MGQALFISAEIFSDISPFSFFEITAWQNIIFSRQACREAPRDRNTGFQNNKYTTRFQESRRFFIITTVNRGGETSLIWGEILNIFLI